jgi:hypothetical protein
MFESAYREDSQCNRCLAIPFTKHVVRTVEMDASYLCCAACKPPLIQLEGRAAVRLKPWLLFPAFSERSCRPRAHPVRTHLRAHRARTGATIGICGMSESRSSQIGNDRFAAAGKRMQSSATRSACC